MTMSDGDGSSTYSGEGGRRGPIEAEKPIPGPKYVLPPCVGSVNHDPTKAQAPSHSIGIPHRREKSCNPGPNAYHYQDNLTHTGPKSTPMYSLQSRHKHKAIELTPGPGAYNTDSRKYGVSSQEATPRASTLAGKERYQFKTYGPPPTNYTVPYTLGTGSPDKSGGKAWSHGMNRDYGGIHYENKVKGTPCASRYGATDPSIFKYRSPAYSQTKRTQQPSYNTSLKNPGPGTYDPKLDRKSGFSFGTRHSSYQMPMITMADINHY